MSNKTQNVIPYRKTRNYTPARKTYSVTNKLVKEGKISNKFQITLANLTFEEVIALKLEQVSTTMNGYFYGFKLYTNFKRVVQEALIKYAVSATRSRKEASMLLGIDESHLKAVIQQWDVNSYFDEESDEREVSENRAKIMQNAYQTIEDFDEKALDMLKEKI